MKTIEEIYGEMMDCFGGETGLEPREGTDLSARMYALAAQVYALYVQADWVARQAFPQTAEGEYLDFHAQLRSLERKPVLPAQGTVRFTAGEAAQEDRSIPKGTVCMTAGLVRFETTREAVLPAGALTADVPAQALEPGEAGNVSAQTIVSMAVAPVGIASCTNPQAFSGGTDGESDEELRERILDTFRRLPNGSNAAFYEQGALSFDQVAAATVMPRPRGVGSVDVIAATLAGTPGEELLEQLQDYFDQRREIAVDVQVKAPTPVTVNVAVQVKAKGGWDKAQVLEQVEEALEGWFDGKLLGRNVLLARLGSLIYGCEGVENYVITAPAADLTVETDQLPVLGTLSVEEMP